MFWGSYRPNLYFGTRTRSNPTLMTGLAWFGTTSLNDKPWENIRHTCEQGDHLEGYAWNKHNGRDFGTQLIKDSKNNVQIKTEFLKVNHGSYGGDWVVRITGEPLEAALPTDISLLFYVGLDGQGSLKQEATESNDFAHLTGSSEFLGDFSFFARDQQNSRLDDSGPYTLDVDLEGINVLPYQVPGSSIWKVKELIQGAMVNTAQKRINEAGGNEALSNIHPSLLFHLEKAQVTDPNLYIFQHTMSGPFTIEYVFLSGANQKVKDASKYFSKALSTKLKNAEQLFDEKFEKVFQLSDKYSKKENDFAKMLLGNMLGGLGYFHGTSIVDNSRKGYDESDLTLEPIDDAENEYFDLSDSDAPIGPPPPNPQPDGPHTLFTGVPSRPFFPRGFLWDSGFDHHLISAFDNEISLDIMASWAALIDEDGWVAREQILGEEARSKVPAEFQIQYPDYANPPTLIGGLKRYMDRREKAYAIIKPDGTLPTHDQQSLEFLVKIYPKFKKQYEWFHETQLGQIHDWNYGKDISYGFKWRGRKNSHILTSGLDDYPRSPVSHPGDLHVDLHSWMVYFAQTLQTVAAELGYDDDAKQFEVQGSKIKEDLFKLHWDDNSNTFADVTFDANEEAQHVVHKGYISIFPLLLGIVPPESPKLEHLLKMIRNPGHLWSPYGICSLSKSDEYFGKDENYWRGPIWVNINYLLLQSLHRNYIHHGPYQTLALGLYTELRRNIIKNVYQNYERSGYVWEQYSCTDGTGSRSHPFTGWTSLVLLAMAEKY
ncbi:glycoside hydrolase [Globomyces pollinis-pini]|nr:glycoside hydrolase [Globomyces pollinis-pini]